MFRTFWLAALLVGTGRQLAAQAPSDTSAIRTAALDYAQGWYTGDADRMSRALHPELVKRIVRPDTVSHHAQLDGMGKSVLVNATRRGFGKRTPVDRQRADIQLLDITGNAAIAKLRMVEWVDYLQLGKVDGRWQIVNVLWELVPEGR